MRDVHGRFGLFISRFALNIQKMAEGERLNVISLLRLTQLSL